MKQPFIKNTDLTNEAYHALDGISASGLKQAWKDPKLYELRGKLKRLHSPALTMGTATHEALLEPENYDVKNYKLTPAYLEKLEVMTHNGKLMFDYIVSKTLNEVSLIVQDNGFTRKVRVDAYDEKQGIIYDIKTTKHNSPSQFIRDAYELGYHIQASFYIDTLRMAGHKADYFAFLCIPNENPCEPYAIQISDLFIEDGREIYNEVIQNILDFKNTNKSVFFRQMNLPEWRLKQKGYV